MTTVYKILTKYNKQYFSYIKSYFLIKGGNSPIVTRYYTNKFIVPRLGKLFAFSSLEDARLYFNNESDHMKYNMVIAEAITSKDIILPDWESLPAYWDSCAIYHYWNTNKKIHAYSMIPKGTVFCEDLKIIKILK